MRIRNTVIALVLLAIIGGYAFVVGYYSKPAPAKKLLDVKPDDIAKIELKYSDRDIVIDRAKGGHWRITAPIGADADQMVAENLARAISNAEVTSTVEEKPADLAPFGLASPATIVSVTTFQHKTLPAIDVGKTTPVGFSAYVKLANSPAVMLTSSAFPSGMNKTVNQLRNRNLMTFKVDDVSRFTIQRDTDPEIELTRTDGKWRITKPGAYLADSTQVRELLSSLANAKVADFIADAPSSVTQYGLEKPHLTVTVYTKNGGQQSLLFGFKQQESGKDGIYVRRGERTPVYTVHEYVMSSVDRTVLQLRDKTVMSFEPSKVGSVDATVDGGHFTLARAPGGKWNLTAGGKTTAADVPVVERFLDEIRGLRGLSILTDPLKSPQMFGLDKPQVEIAVKGKDGKTIGVMKLSKIKIKPAAAQLATGTAPAQTEYYATSTAGTALYTLSGFSFSQLDKPASLFAARTPAAAAPTPAAK
jgi:Domain of unknown function (DUF4340)